MDKRFNIEGIWPLMKKDIVNRWGEIKEEPSYEQLSNHTEFRNYISTQYGWDDKDLDKYDKEIDEIHAKYSKDEYIKNKKSELNDKETVVYEADNKSNEYCGVEEFEGIKFDTCKDEKIVEEGFDNPDR